MPLLIALVPSDNIVHSYVTDVYVKDGCRARQSLDY